MKTEFTITSYRIHHYFVSDSPSIHIELTITTHRIRHSNYPSGLERLALKKHDALKNMNCCQNLLIRMKISLVFYQKRAFIPLSFIKNHVFIPIDFIKNKHFFCYSSPVMMLVMVTISPIPTVPSPFTSPRMPPIFFQSIRYVALSLFSIPTLVA